MPTERDLTDSTLNEERDRTDTELLERTAAVADRADDVLQRAREQARRVLALARERADRAMSARGASAAEHDALAQERAAEDMVRQTEQHSATAKLQLEREERRLALEFLLEAERRATDEMLRAERTESDEALRWRDDILTMVVHDLRGLTDIVGLSAAVIATTAEPGGGVHQTRQMSKILQRAHAIQLASARTSKLIEDLLDLSRLERGRLVCAPVRALLQPTFEELSTFLAPAAKEHGISFEVTLPDAELAAVFDPERLNQILMNLVLNALKFTPHGGWVELTAERSGDAVSITVADTGPWIADEHLSYIFDKMWQADPRDRRGVGLGLYIARQLVLAQGGNIAARRRPEGAGTIVTVTLPAR